MRWELPVSQVVVMHDREKDDVSIKVDVWVQSHILEVRLLDVDSALVFLSAWIEYCRGVREKAPSLTLEVP